MQNTENKDTIIPDKSSVINDFPKVRPLWRFLYLLISPISGWKRLKNARYNSDDFARQVFYPILAIISACTFIELYYQPDLGLVAILQNAITVFVSFFIGYFSILFIAGLILPSDARIKIGTQFGKTFIMCGLSSMAVLYFFYEIFPGIASLLIFTLIYVAYIIFSGVRFLRVQPKELIATKIIMIILIIGIPIVISVLLKALMPEVDNQQI